MTTEILPDDASKVSILDVEKASKGDKSLEELRQYDEPDFIVVVTDIDMFYDRMGITG